jgi:hypothetical protein
MLKKRQQIMAAWARFAYTPPARVISFDPRKRA